MNTIIVKDSKLDLNDEEVTLNICTKKLELNITNSVFINDIDNNEDLELTINMNDNSNLLYNRNNIDINKFNLTINIKNNSRVEFNHSLYQNIPCVIKEDTNISGNDNYCTINIHGVTDKDGQINSSATGNVIKNIKNNEFLENIRIMMLNDAENIIIPNLLASSNEVNILHNATISSLPKDYLFYLKSKGLDEQNASDLIIKGFLKNNLKGGAINE